MAICGPVSAAALAESLGVSTADADAALLALESDGAVLRGVFTPGARTRRMVRSRAAGAHSPVHAQPPARRNFAGHACRVHAVPLRVAARGSLDGADGTRRAQGGRRAARRRRGAGARMGARSAAGESRTVRAGAPRHAVPDRRGELGAAVHRAHSGRGRDADCAVPPRARGSMADPATGRRETGRRRSTSRQRRACPRSPALPWRVVRTRSRVRVRE